MNEREHLVILKRGRLDNIIGATCAGCGYDLDSPTAFHPESFCILVKAGYDPVTVVREAAPRLPKPYDPSYGNHPSQLPVKAVPTLAGER